MKLSESIKPTPEIITEVKKSYNRLLKRMKDGRKYLDNPNIPEIEQDKRQPIFFIEIVQPMESYVKLLQEWGVHIDESEILGGMKLEK